MSDLQITKVQLVHQEEFRVEIFYPHPIRPLLGASLEVSFPENTLIGVSWIWLRQYGQYVKRTKAAILRTSDYHRGTLQIAGIVPYPNCIIEANTPQQVKSLKFICSQLGSSLEELHPSDFIRLNSAIETNKPLILCQQWFNL